MCAVGLLYLHVISIKTLVCANLLSLVLINTLRISTPAITVTAESKKSHEKTRTRQKIKIMEDGGQELVRTSVEIF
jgi:hypothetical protein